MTKQIQRYAAIIFDMDGLMLDTEKIGKQSMEAAARDLGLLFPDDLYTQLIGRNSRDNHRVLTELFGNSATVDQLQECSRQHYIKLINAEPPAKMKGLENLLDFIETNHTPMAVATSTSNTTALFKLTQTGLLSRFASITTGDQIEHGKPAPDIYLLAAKKMGIRPADCLALEDSPQGSRAAHAAGMPVLVIPDLVAPPEDVIGFATGVFKDLDEVHDWLARMTTVN